MRSTIGVIVAAAVAVGVYTSGYLAFSSPDGPFGPGTGTAVGQVAPLIEGEDLDGKPLSLADYRGKVVVLNFWAHWCPYCRSLYKEQHALATKFHGDGFAILGVNGDRIRDKARDALQRAKLSFRSWYDGDDLAISDNWGVESVPTIFVIDHKWLIREKYEGVPPPGELAAAVERLLNERAEDPAAE
jgi:peroxiredoxin